MWNSAEIRLKREQNILMRRRKNISKNYQAGQDRVPIKR